MQALKNEIKQKAIFMSLINIKETIKNIQDSADAEVMVIFCEEDMKRLSKSRNIAAHNSSHGFKYRNKSYSLRSVGGKIKFPFGKIKLP